MSTVLFLYYFLNVCVGCIDSRPKCMKERQSAFSADGCLRLDLIHSSTRLTHAAFSLWGSADL